MPRAAAPCAAVPDPRDVNHWVDRRRAGALLHITSLPGPGPWGVLGEEARGFVDSLCEGGFSVWQFLPLGPTHGHGSPYESLSSFAGNPELIDLRECALHGWIDPAQLDAARKVANISTVRRIAAEGFWRDVRHHADLAEDVRRFQARHADWLDDFSLFMALKQTRRNAPWWRWPRALRRRDPQALKEARNAHGDIIRQVIFEQYLFARQWQNLKIYAESRDVLLFGDLPIYAAHDSADVWSHQEYFTINDAGLCEEVAGVPPDYFSTTGQRWGNPLYRWEYLQRDHFDWWIKRIQTQLERMHLLRIDHFRGLEAYWAIPAACADGRTGEWRKAPGGQLLQALHERLGRLPLVAEDLGLITPEVTALLHRFGLPGMKVLQFAFDGSPDNPYLPENFGSDSVTYLGTHDNDTTLGWFEKLNDDGRAHLGRYVNSSGDDMPWPMIRLALDSTAELAVISMQDLLSLDSHARLNTPGTVRGNWKWRLKKNQASPQIWARVRELNQLSGRANPHIA